MQASHVMPAAHANGNAALLARVSALERTNVSSDAQAPAYAAPLPNQSIEPAKQLSDKLVQLEARLAAVEQADNSRSAAATASVQSSAAVPHELARLAGRVSELEAAGMQAEQPRAAPTAIADGATSAVAVAQPSQSTLEARMGLVMQQLRASLEDLYSLQVGLEQTLQSMHARPRSERCSTANSISSSDQPAGLERDSAGTALAAPPATHHLPAASDDEAAASGLEVERVLVELRTQVAEAAQSGADAHAASQRLSNDAARQDEQQQQRDATVDQTLNVLCEQVASLQQRAERTAAELTGVASAAEVSGAASTQALAAVQQRCGVAERQVIELNGGVAQLRKQAAQVEPLLRNSQQESRSEQATVVGNPVSGEEVTIPSSHHTSAVDAVASQLAAQQRSISALQEAVAATASQVQTLDSSLASMHGAARPVSTSASPPLLQRAHNAEGRRSSIVATPKHLADDEQASLDAEALHSRLDTMRAALDTLERQIVRSAASDSPGSRLTEEHSQRQLHVARHGYTGTLAFIVIAAHGFRFQTWPTSF